MTDEIATADDAFRDAMAEKAKADPYSLDTRWRNAMAVVGKLPTDKGAALQALNDAGRLIGWLHGPDGILAKPEAQT